MSQVNTLFPHLVPGLCGALECPAICSRVCHCPAGQRRVQRLLQQQRRHRLTARPNRQQLEACQRIQEEGLCPSACDHCGGCFLPQYGDSPAELKRKAHRPQRVMDALVTYRQFGRFPETGKEVRCAARA